MVYRYVTKKISSLYLTTLALVCAVSLCNAYDIVNFSSPVTVSAFVEEGDTLWAASSGGLVAHDLRRGSNALISNAKIFPDPYLTSLCRDKRGNLWAGSRGGYLYKKTPRGQWTAYSNYKLAGWGILSLHYYAADDLIVVGADKGLSLFDPQKESAVRNASAIGTFSNPRVNAITVSRDRDTLFLGCEEGVAFLDSLNVNPLKGRNFYYPKIWKTRDDKPIVSLVNTDRGVIADTVPAAMFRGYMFTAHNGYIRYGDSSSARVTPGRKILTLYNEGDKRLWIGTEDDYYFSFDGETHPEHNQHRVGGLSLRQGTRIAVADNGDVWVLPVVRYRGITWHHGVYRYDGRSWYLYNESTHGLRFGYIGDSDARGFAFGRDGTVWVGTAGGNLKHINPIQNTAAQLIVGNRNFEDVRYYDSNPENNEWGASNAVAIDSTGYLWASVFDHNLGSLICYDPRYRPNPAESDPAMAHYRWLFDRPPLKTLDITALNVDIDNRVFVYDGSQNQLTVFRHSGNPLRDSIKVDTSYERINTISEIKSVPNGATYMVGAGGLQKISRGSLKIESIDNTLVGLSSIVVQGDILWLGSYTNGILRYDLTTGNKKWIGENEGLISASVSSIALDEKNGYLWFVAENVVSRLDVGRSAAVTSGRSMRVVPNVFSISGRGQGTRHVTFTDLEPRSSVFVYTVNGALVAKVNAEYFTEREWRAAWAPKRNLAPGTYFAVAKPSGKRAKMILKP